MTSTERHKRPTAARKPVEREKSLSLDDVFAKSFLKDAYGGTGNHRNGRALPKESRSLCGDRSTTKKSMSRSALKTPRSRNSGDNDEAEESGNETDTGHSVATTGHRSQRRISKMNRSLAAATSSPIKRSHATAAEQILSGLYSTANPKDDTESEASSRKSGDKSPVKRSQASKSKSTTSSRPELSKDQRSCRRSASDTPPSGDEALTSRDGPRTKSGSSARAGGAAVRSSRDRPENARAKSSINLSSGKPDRNQPGERKVQIHPDNSGEDSNVRAPRSPSKVPREKEKSERHLGDRPKAKSERHIKERGKSERHLKDREPPERRLRERSKSRTRAAAPPTPKSGVEGTPRVSRSGNSSRDGTPRQPSSSVDPRSRSRRRKDEAHDNPASPDESKPPGKSKSSPRPTLSSSSSKSRTLDKATSKHNERPSKLTPLRDVRCASAGNDDPESDGKDSPATDRRRTESTGATATATEDALSSSDDESSNVDDNGTVLQFDPSQQGDNAVYRAQQITSAVSRTASGKGQIAALVDPLGAARQLDQPSGHFKDKNRPIFQFLESTDFDFIPPSSLSPLDRPSGEDEVSEDDDLVDSPGNNDSRQSFGVDVVPEPTDAFFPGLAEGLGRDENQFGYSGDGTFVDDNNPYGYNVEETFETQGGQSRTPAPFGPSNDSYDEDAYLYDDDDIGTGSFSNPYGFGTAEPMIPATDTNDDGSQLFETDSTSHYDQQSTLHDSFMPQSGAPQFNPTTFGGTEPFFINPETDDDASFEGAWEAAKTDPKASAVEFDQSFDQSFNFDELKRPASTDGSRSNMQQSHESNDLEGRRPPGEGPKKKRVVKVKVIKKNASGFPSEEQGGQEQGKTVKRKVVRKKVKSAPPADGTAVDAASDSTKDKEQSPAATEPVNERKKALHQMKAPKTPQTPTKVFVSKLYGSLSRFNNSGNLNSDDGSLTEEGLIGATKQLTRSPAANLQPGMSPGASASGKRAFATSIGRYFSRNVRNPPIAGSVGNGTDEGSISTNNSRGSRGSLGLFVGKKSNRAKHQLLGDDSSYDSGNLVKRN